MALGTQAGDIVRLVMKGWPRDPAVFDGVALGLGAVALIAVAIPAWRATRADPLEAMRPE